MTRGENNFRFYDNRQKYLMFVNTCSEKWEVAKRCVREFDRLDLVPPAIRVFDAGIGDGTVLARIMRALHQRYRRFPFFIAGKEISLEDVRLTLEKMPDRFFEHPEMVLAVTNLPYADAPWLVPVDGAPERRVQWTHVALTGRTTAEFEQQLLELQPLLAEAWRTRVHPRTGALVPETPTTLILYRQDCAFLLDDILPRRDHPRADYNLVLACQPFRLRADLSFKARRILAPLARALAPGGRLLGIHSAGGDPGLEATRRVLKRRGALWFQDESYVIARRRN